MAEEKVTLQQNESYNVELETPYGYVTGKIRNESNHELKITVKAVRPYKRKK